MTSALADTVKQLLDFSHLWKLFNRFFVFMITYYSIKPIPAICR
jgi:hypothetical protein